MTSPTNMVRPHRSLSVVAMTTTTTMMMTTMLMMSLMMMMINVTGHGMVAGTREADRVCRTVELREEHPVLCHMLDRLVDDQATLAGEIQEWAAQHGLLVGDQLESRKGSSIPKVKATTTTTTTTTANPNQLPVVFAHGMGDSCFNSGMKHIGDHTSELLGGNGNGNRNDNDTGVFVTCIPTGDTQTEDTTNGYFLNMDASVDVFAAKIRDEPRLAGGFHAIGFSQGNNVIRGYIGRYNDPPVDTFLSVNGVNAGVGAVPYCRPNSQNKGDTEQPLELEDGLVGGGMCDLLMEQASRRAYTEWTQEHSFQANYWRDPRSVERDQYEGFAQLARWNNEVPPDQFNQTLKDNYAKTNTFVWVMATEDKMVWPKEGEHWGAPDPKDPFHSILPMNETEWYQKDLFGLKTAQEAGKNYFESFQGDHLQFEMEDFDRWVTTYLAVKEESEEFDVAVA